jgi:MFS transporter, DHA2 family, lincomycin resistance protein
MTSPTEVSSDLRSEASTPTSTGDYGVLWGLLLGTFVVLINETIMVNAIPRLMIEFSVSARSAQWLSTVFMLTMAVVIPVTGWLLARVPTRTAFTGAMSVFGVGTLVAGLAPVFGALLAGRAIQAMGAAVMLPLLMTTLMKVVPEHDRGRVMGRVTMTISIAPALGPTASGLVLQALSWRWLFGLVLPAVVLIVVLGLRRMTNYGELSGGPIDWLSVVAAALGFGGLVYGVSQLGAGRAASVWPAVPITAATVVIVLFVWRQLRLQRAGHPLLDLRTLKVRTFSISLAVLSMGFMAMLGTVILLPMYLQEVRGLSALQTGLVVMPGGVVMGLMGPSVGRLFDRLGGRPLVVPGAAGVLLALASFTTVGSDTPVVQVLLGHMLLMASLATLFTPVFTLALGALPSRLHSHGSSMLGTMQQVAAAVGTAIVVTVMSWRSAALIEDGSGALEALVGGMRAGFGFGAATAIGLLALVMVLPNRPTVGDVDADPELETGT